ncbi:MAG: hypothetical protein AAFV07_03370 [Bacteroidota bacterium]
MLIPYQTYLRVGQAYAEELKERPDVLGVILAGSWLDGQPDPNADIDIPVILAPETGTRQRGNTWREGIEIEFLENPPQQIRAYFRQEASPHTAHMLAHGQLVWHRDPVVPELIAEAKAIWTAGPPPLSDFARKMMRYRIDDLRKDLADCQALNNVFGERQVRQALVDLCLDAFCGSHGLWQDKAKRVWQQVQEVDADFARLLLDFQTGDKAAEADLFTRTAQFIGGVRSRDWFLQGPLDLR